MFALPRTYFLLFILIISQTLCQSAKEITISDSPKTEEFTQQSRENSLYLKCLNFNKAYLHVKVKPIDEAVEPYTIFVGQTETASKQFASDMLMQSGTNDNHMYIPRSYFNVKDGASSIYISIYSNSYTAPTNYNVEFTYEDEIEITIEKDYSLISIRGNQKNVFRFNRSEYDSEYVMNFYAIGGHDDDIIDMSIQLKGPFVDHETIPHQRYENLFYGGDGLTVPQTTFKTMDPPIHFHEGQYFVITVETKENVLIRVGAEYEDPVDDLDHIYANNTLNGYISLKTAKCYRIVNNDKSSQMFAYVRSRSGIKFYLTNKNNGEIEDPTLVHQVKGTGTFVYTPSDIERLGVLCFGVIDTGIADFQIQLINDDSLNVARPLLDPLYNGLPHSLRLNKGQLQMYMYSKFMANEDIEINYNVRTIMGKLNVYVLPTQAYPFISFRPNQGEGSTAQKLSDINGFFQYHGTHKDEGNAWSSNKNLLVVECPSTSSVACQFEVSFFDGEDSLEIQANNRYLQTMLPKEEDHFTFKIEDDNIKYILIELSTLTGDSNMEVFKKAPVPDNVTSYYIGNKEVVQISRSNVTESLTGVYQIVISSASSCVYTVSYYLYRQNQDELAVDIDGGLQVIEYMTVHDTKKVKMQNRYNKRGYTYISTFTPLNCKFDIVFNSNTKLQFQDEHYFQHEIKSTDTAYSAYEYVYSITATDMSNGDTYDYDGELCIIYIASASVETDDEIVVNEATPITVSLDNELKYVNFLFPRPPNSGEVIVRVNVEADTLLKLEYKTENYLSGCEFSRSRQVIITETDLNRLCKDNNVCPISFYLAGKDELQDIMEGIQVEFEVKTRNNKVPTYLKKSKLYDDFVYNDSIQYFVCDISPSEVGEVILNFNRGRGYLVGKIIRKDITEEDPDWNNKVKLPVPNGDDILDTYDPLTNKLRYSQFDTEQCVRGCDLYIGVVGDENYIVPHIDEFTIYVRPITEVNDPIDIPINEFVHGALTNISNIEYYSFNLPMKVSKVSIEFHSEMCHLYLNKGTTKPTEVSYNNHYYSEGMSFLFEPLIDDDSKYDRYTLGVMCKSLSHIFYSPYTFRVRIVQENDIELIELDSNHETLGRFKERATYCDFIVSNDLFDDLTQVTFYVTPHEETELALYAVVIPQQEFDKLSTEGKRSRLPRAGGSSVITSANQFRKDYLYLNVTIPDSYILVSVYSTEIVDITLMHSYRTGIEGIHVDDFIPRLIQIEPQQTLSFIVQNEYDTSITISSVHGNGMFIYGSDHALPLQGERQQLHYYQLRYTFPIAQISNNGIEPYIFYVWYQASPLSVSMNEISYGVTNKLFFTSLSSFPLIHYAKYNVQEAITVSFQITSISHLMVIDSSPDDFTIVGYAVNKEFICDLQLDMTARPEGRRVEGYYDYPSRTGYLEFDQSHTILELEKQMYLLIIINKADTNANSYGDLSYDLSVLPQSYKLIPAQPGMYHYNEIKQDQTGGNVHYLAKKSTTQRQMKFEFAANNKYMNFAISSTPFEYAQQSYTNQTNIISKVNTKGRKVSFMIDVSQYNGVYLGVFLEQNEFNTRATKYSYKFTLDPQDEEELTVPQTFELKNTTSQRIDEIIVSFVPITNKQGNKVRAMYHIKFYSKSKLESNEIIDTITPTPMQADVIRKINFEELNMNEQATDVVFKDLNIGTYEVTIVAQIQSTKELFTYAKQEFVLPNIFNVYPFNTLNILTRSSFSDNVHAYIHIPENSPNNILFMKLRDFQYTTEVVGNIDRFNLTAYYVDEVFIALKKSNPSAQPTTPAFNAIHYQTENFYYINMHNTDTSKNIIYFEIERNRLNKNYYDDYTIELTAFNPHDPPNFVHTPGQFYINTLTRTNPIAYHKIKRIANNDYYAIECSPHYMDLPFVFTVEEYNNENTLPTGQNTTDIIKQVSYLNGKIYILVHSQANALVVTFTNANTVVLDDDKNVVEYFYKYTTHATVPMNDFDKYALQVNYIQISDIASFTVKNLMHTEPRIKKVHYRLRIYRESILFPNQHIQSSQFIPSDEEGYTLEPDALQIITVNTRDETVNISLNMNYLEMPMWLYISAHAELDTEEIKVGYNPTSFTAIVSNIVSFGDFFTITSDHGDLKYRFIDPPDNYITDSIIMKIRNNPTNDNFKCYAAFVDFEYVRLKLLNNYNLPEIQREQIIYHQYEQAGYLTLTRPDLYKTHYIYIDCSETPSSIQFEARFIVYSYNGLYTPFMLPQNEYYVDTLTSNENKKMYTLRKRSLDDVFFEIEYAEETNKKHFTVSVESYTEGQAITCETNPRIVVQNNTLIGKTQLVIQPLMQDKDKPLVLCFAQHAPLGGSNAAFEFKYRTFSDINSVNVYKHNPNITMISNEDNEIEFSIENANYKHQDGVNTIYYYRIFKYNTNIRDFERVLNTVYISTQLELTMSETRPFVEGVEISSNDTKLTTFQTAVKDDDIFYISVVGIYYDASTGQQHKLGYYLHHFNTMDVLIDKIEYGTRRSFTHYNYKGAPLSIYAELPQTSLNTTVHITLRDIKYSHLVLSDTFNVVAYVVDETFIENKKNGQQVIPPENGVVGVNYVYEKVIVVDVPTYKDNQNKFVYIELKPQNAFDSVNYYTQITFDTSVYEYGHVIELDEYEHSINTIHDDKQHVTYLLKPTYQYVYVEFGEKENVQALQFAIENEKTTPTYNNQIQYETYITNGKTSVIFHHTSHMLFSLMNEQSTSTIEFYIKYKSAQTKETLLKYVNYNSTVDYTYETSSLTINIFNVLSLRDNNMNAVTYYVDLYSTYQISNPNVVETLFHSNDVSLDITPEYSHTFTLTQSTPSRVTQQLRATPNMKYYVVMKAFISNKETHRFGFESFDLDTTQPYFPQVKLNEHSVHCFNENLQRFSFFMDVRAVNALPHVNIKYYNVATVNGDKVNEDKYSIKGYNVNKSFIDKRKTSNDEQTTSTPAYNAKTILSGNSLYVYPNKAKDNNYVYLDITKDADNHNRYLQICFDIYAYDKSSPSLVFPLMENQYVYNEVSGSEIVSYKLNFVDERKTYYIELIQGYNYNNNVLKVFAESYKSTPSYLDELTMNYKNEDGKLTATFDATQEVYLHVQLNNTSKLRSTDNENFLIKYTTYKDINEVPSYSAKDIHVNKQLGSSVVMLSFENLLMKYNNTFTEGSYTIRVFNENDKQFNKDYVISLLTDKVDMKLMPIYSFTHNVPKNAPLTITKEIPAHDKVDITNMFATVSFDLYNNEGDNTKIAFPGVSFKNSKTNYTLIIVLAVVAVIVLLVVVIFVIRKRKGHSSGEFKLPTDEMKLVDDSESDIN